MKKLWLAALVCAIVPLSRANAAANIVTNGGFETPVVPAQVQFVTFFGGQSFGNWTVTGNTANSVDQIRDPATAGELSQYVDLSGQDTGGISQTLTTVPGQTYSLTFLFAGNYGAPPAVKTMDLFWNGTKIASPSFDTTGHGAANVGWTPLQFNVTATSSSTVLQFQSTTAGAYGPFIDAVSVVATPEPGSLLMLGLGGAALLRRAKPARR